MAVGGTTEFILQNVFCTEPSTNLMTVRVVANCVTTEPHYSLTSVNACQLHGPKLVTIATESGEIRSSAIFVVRVYSFRRTENGSENFYHFSTLPQIQVFVSYSQ